MKVAVLGGTGRTGVHIVEYALDKGHELKVLARDPDKMTIDHNNLMVIQGNALRLEDMKELMKGCNAVISAIGPTRNTPGGLMENSASNMVKAMSEENIDRIVYLTGAGYEIEQDEPGLVDKLIKFLLKVFSGAVLKDSINGVNEIIKSDTNWTIVRAPRLVDGESKEELKVGYVGDISSSLVRIDLAKFMVDQLDDDRWIEKFPAVSN